MACNCTDLSYNFVNCILDIICDGRIIHSINMDKAAIKNYGINGDVEISPCCGEIVKLSQVNLDQLNLTIVDLQNFRSQCAVAAASAQDYEAGNYTLLCDSLDANTSYLAYYTFTDGVKENHYITLPSGVDTIGDLPATAMQCKEAKVINNCFKVGSEIWYNLICLQGLNIVGNIWVNTTTGTAQNTSPVGATPCEEKDKETNTYCYKAIINGTGYSIGDTVEFKQIFDVNDPLNPSFVIWFNKNALSIVYLSDTINPANNTGTFPNISDFVPCEDYIFKQVGAECTYNKTECLGYSDNTNFYTATNAIVKFDVANLGGGIFHIGIEDGSYTGAFGLVSSNLALNDGLRIFDDVYFPNPGMRLWKNAILNLSSALSGRRIEFDYDTNIVPEFTCDAVLTENQNANTLFSGTTGGDTGFVAFIGITLNTQSVQKNDKSIRVQLDECTIDKLMQSNTQNEMPNGITYENDTNDNNPQPVSVKSITVTKQSGSEVNVSFDSGATWPVRIVSNGSRTWGQGNSDTLDSSKMKFKQLGAGVYDIIWEQ